MVIRMLFWLKGIPTTHSWYICSLDEDLIFHRSTLLHRLQFITWCFFQLTEVRGLFHLKGSIITSLFDRTRQNNIIFIIYRIEHFNTRGPRLGFTTRKLEESIKCFIDYQSWKAASCKHNNCWPIDTCF